VDVVTRNGATGLAPDALDAAEFATAPELDPIVRDSTVGRWAAVYDGHTESGFAARVAVLFAGVGCLMGRAAVQYIGSTPHHARVFVALVGPTATGRKGTAVQEATTLLDGAMRGTLSELTQSGLSTAEGLLNCARDDSVNSKGDLTEGFTDKRRLIVEEELATVLRRMAGRESTLGQVLRMAWDGGTLRTLTRTSPLKVTAPHFVLVGCITPAELRATAADVDFQGGTLNRVLLVHAMRERVLANPTPPPESAVEGVAAAIADAVAYAETVTQVTLSPDAERYVEAIYPRWSSEHPGRVGQVMPRAMPTIRRLAMVEALASCRNVISAHDLRVAEALVGYHQATAELLWPMNFTADATRIRAGLAEAQAAGLTRNGIRALFGSNNVSASRIAEALRELHNAGVAIPRRVPTAGRPAELWTLSTYVPTPTDKGELGLMGRKGETAPEIGPIDATDPHSSHKPQTSHSRGQREESQLRTEVVF